jgi:aspartate carbamoyltransferase catalytic subunit
VLDIYTLRYSFATRGGIDGKKVLLVGDVSRNRDARWLAYLLTKFDVPSVHFVSHKDFPPDDDVVAYTRKHGIDVQVHEDLGATLRNLGREVDAIYVTRLQQDWDGGGTHPEGKLGTADPYVLKAEYRPLVRDDCVLMHPLPRINELPEAWEDHPGFVVWRQVRNGMWIRAALFAAIFGADAEIRARAVRLGLLG